MSLIEIVLLAIALGIDCCIVSFSQGLIFKSQRVKNSLFLALTMGIFQGLMPCIGYTGADVIHKYVAPFSNFIVFAIFMILGIKFIAEAFQTKDDEICCIGLKCLMGMGIATSIDALAVGVTFAFLNIDIIPICVSIGVITFLVCFIGVLIGKKIGSVFKNYAQIVGGIILVLIGLNILNEHTQIISNLFIF